MNELDLFAAAQAITDPVERSNYLNRACGDNTPLRERVEALLSANAQADITLQHTPTPPSSAATDPTLVPESRPLPQNSVCNESVDRVIAGKYMLIEQVGEGGMGSVWRAKQSEPVKRFVAVKLIKVGMDSKAVVARFEAERQALALMDHPNIARVLDGGLDQNRPYFVMELVKGILITEYCDRQRLNPNQRLELFVQTCQAIQHAHQKGIIHRDIKPSNVLVTLYDDKPVVKVIDFGVAKATGGILTEATIDTGIGNIVGTPQYMSPEQATFNNADIDTRSDVYALGVLLYELLTGSPPFSMHELQKKGFLEILRVVREVDPPRPSTKLSTADALPTLSANRGTEPKKLTGLLRNELDWIVMKALEKDRVRRYETANDFAADVMRYLAGEPVQAHPPSTAYRLKKFVKRNRVQMTAASLVLLAMVSGIVGTSLGLREAWRQQRLAQKSEEMERQAKEEAIENLAFAEKGNEILGSVFAGLNPDANYATIGELSQALKDNLKKAVKELEGSAIGDPVTVAQMQHQLGNALLGLGDKESAILLFEKSRNTLELKRGIKDPDTLKSMYSMAIGYKADGNLTKALPLFEETMRLQNANLGADHPDTLASMISLAWAYNSAGKLDQAQPLAEEAMKLARAKLGLEHVETLHSMSNLAQIYLAAGELELAMPLLEETLKITKATLGGEHPNTVACMISLATGYESAGKRELSIAILEETLALQKARLGADHPSTLKTTNNLARAYQHNGKLAQALPLLEETLKHMKATMGPDHPDTMACMNNLASGYYYLGNLDLSLPHFEETLKLQKAKLGADHPNTLTNMNNLAVAYWAAGKQGQALPLLEETFELTKAKLGSEHPNTLDSMGSLATGYKRVGKLDLALPLFEEAIRLQKKKLGPNHPNTISTLGSAGSAYSAAKQGKKAAELLNEFISARRKKSSNDDPQFAGLLAKVSLELLQCEQFYEAEKLLRECLAIREAKEPDAWNTFNSMSLLGGALLKQSKYDEAEQWLLKGFEGLKAREKSIPSQASARISEALDRLIECSDAMNKTTEMENYRELRSAYQDPAEKKGLIARQRTEPDQHPTLTSNAVMCELIFARLVSAIVPR